MILHMCSVAMLPSAVVLPNSCTALAGEVLLKSSISCLAQLLMKCNKFLLVFEREVGILLKMAKKKKKKIFSTLNDV